MSLSILVGGGGGGGAVSKCIYVYGFRVRGRAKGYTEHPGLHTRDYSRPSATNLRSFPLTVISYHKHTKSYNAP